MPTPSMSAAVPSRRGAMRARDGAKRNVEPICPVDRYDGERQIGELLLVELRARGLVDVVGHVSLGDQSDCFGPGQSRALRGHGGGDDDVHRGVLEQSALVRHRRKVREALPV